jgi:hypothetical protein
MIYCMIARLILVLIILELTIETLGICKPTELDVVKDQLEWPHRVVANLLV